MLHSPKLKNKCSEEYIGVKTSLSKAFDRVEWFFLDYAMKIFGFP